MDKGLKIAIWVVAILAIVGGFIYFAGYRLSSTSEATHPPVNHEDSGGSDNEADTSGVKPSSCTIQSTLGSTLKDKYNGTALAPTNRVFVDGDMSDDTTTPFDVDFNKPVQLLQDDGQHYAAFAEIRAADIGCGKNTVVVDAYPNATLSNVSFDNANQAGAATAIGASDHKIQKLSLQVDANKAFSNPVAPEDARPIICVNSNTTEFTQVILIGGDSADRPKQHSVGSGLQADCWYAPFHHLKDGEEQTMSFQMESTGTNPVTPGVITGTVYDVDGFVYKTGVITWGVEDRSTGTAVDVGGVNPSFVLRYS